MTTISFTSGLLQYAGMINVTDHGAVGDGSADDTIAVQAAFSAVPSGGGTVYFPPGVYRLTDTTLVRRSGTKIVGAGQNASILSVAEADAYSNPPLPNATIPAIFQLNSISNTTGNEGNEITDVTIDGLTFRGPTTVAASTMKAINTVTSRRVRIRNCHFTLFGNETIWPSGPSPYTNDEWVIENNSFLTCWHSGSTLGAASVITGNGADWTIANNIFRDCYASIGPAGGGPTTPGGTFAVTGNVIVDDVGGGISIGDATGTGNIVSIAANVLVYTAQTYVSPVRCIRVTAPCRNIAIVGNVVYCKQHVSSAGGFDGIAVGGSSSDTARNVTVTGNAISVDVNSVNVASVGIVVTTDAAFTNSVILGGNTVEFANTGTALCIGIQGSSNVNGGTLKAVVTGNYVKGLTRSPNTHYAYDFTLSGTGVMQAYAVGNVADGGYQRWNGNLYQASAGDTTWDNVPIDDVPTRMYSRGGRNQTRIVLTYGATIATDASFGNWFSITATNGTAFTISNPANPVTGQQVMYTIRNTSGGALGALTFGTVFKIGASWTQPANGFSRTITFAYDGTNWIEVGRTAVNVSN